MKMDIHIHSKYSKDSLSSPKCILKTVKKKKLDAFSVTDHNTLKGSLAIRKLIKGSKSDKAPLFISGIEVNTNIGDVICLFIDKKLKSQNINDLIDEVKDRDGILILSHPYASHSFNKSDDFLKKIDGIETFNSRVTPKQNKKAKSLDETLNKPKIGVSDSHWLETIGNGYTIIEEEASSSEEIRRLIKKGLTIAKGKYTSSYYWHKSNVVRSFREPKIIKIPGSLYGYLKYSIIRK
jgi:predicted metal-dependent phosphoesterase TrpH